ncbi:YhcN/YlaJ family sporulation lipoprotein [Neobacillus sp. K501]
MGLYNRMIIMVCIMLLSACSHDENLKDSQLALMKTTNPNPIMTDQDRSHDRVEKIEKEVNAFDEIYDASIVKGKEETLVVYKVKHMQRFRMKDIEKNLTKILEDKYPKEKFVVSSDYKIFLEAVRLSERMKNGKLSDQQAEKRFSEIIKMTTDMK